MVEVKEKPILFKGEMVRAILADKKTQTRRIMKLKMPKNAKKEVGEDYSIVKYFVTCPYGKVGDRLWVRESFSAEYFNIFYKATEADPDKFKWKPSIHMPRTACRIILEVLNVRVERVQDITGDDAVAEGVPCTKLGLTYEKNLCRAQFADLWNSINLSRGYGWDTNPWVWVVEFKRL